MKRVLRDLAHHRKRQRNDAPPAEMAEHDHQDTERDHRAERDARFMRGGPSVRERIDEPPRVHGNDDLGECGKGHRERDADEQGLALGPMPEHERQNLAKGE